MTHDHAEDAAICDAALRCGHLGSIGLIGSSAKWRRFEAILRPRGPRRPEAVARITTPIGLPEPGRQGPVDRRDRRRRRADPVARARGRRPAADGRRAGLGDASSAGPSSTRRATPSRSIAAPRRGRRRLSSSSTARISARGPFAEAVRDHPGRTRWSTCARAWSCPGIVDTHVHYPQVRVIGALGMPLLQWLDECALPEEARLAQSTTPARSPTSSSQGLVSAGTTTALVFGSHFASAVDALFEEWRAPGSGSPPGSSRATAGSPSRCSPHRTASMRSRWPSPARWHRRGPQPATRSRLGSPTPRARTCSTHVGRCSRTSTGSWFTSHVNESLARGRGGRRALRRGGALRRHL